MTIEHGPGWLYAQIVAAWRGLYHGTPPQTPTHRKPHLVDGLCQCVCVACVDQWREMSGGGARRHCTCPQCVAQEEGYEGRPCPQWRLDREVFELVRGQQGQQGYQS